MNNFYFFSFFFSFLILSIITITGHHDILDNSSTTARVFEQSWPIVDQVLIDALSNDVSVAITVNGRKKAEVKVPITVVEENDALVSNSSPFFTLDHIPSSAQKQSKEASRTSPLVKFLLSSQHEEQGEGRRKIFGVEVAEVSGVITPSGRKIVNIVTKKKGK